MLCSVYTTIAGEYDGPGFCTPIGYQVIFYDKIKKKYFYANGYLIRQIYMYIIIYIKIYNIYIYKKFSYLKFKKILFTHKYI